MSLFKKTFLNKFLLDIKEKETKHPVMTTGNILMSFFLFVSVVLKVVVILYMGVFF